MTTRPAARRLLAWIAPPVGLGALTLAAKPYIGLPGWAVLLSAMVVGTVISTLPTLLPQESAHRRDVWRDLLRHRERMARLRISAAEARRDAARPRSGHRVGSG
ncbi:hypothetical protein [Streptomyces sp. NPDC008240]|uniref:hypothetical protein n=1 Tax=Streptomyces sp. NPDC008240 TaxID=3364822 RepID=UPI0036E02603